MAGGPVKESAMVFGVTLVLAGVLTLVHLWLSMRVGAVRRREGVSVGDGGNEQVIRRMRAHANFVENAPLTVVLVFAIEVARGSPIWLVVAAALFAVARVLHPLGMDGWYPGRAIGTALSMLVEGALAIWALAIVAKAFAA